MQTREYWRALRAFVIPAAFVLAASACSSANDPYARLPSPPLVEARLQTVTLVAADAAFADRLQQAGYRRLPFPPNYPAADDVQAVLWGVSAPIVKSGAVFAPPADGVAVRLLVEPSPGVAPAAALPADAGLVRSFYRNVLGSDVPQWPAAIERGAGVRVQVWSFQIKSVLDARKKLRQSAIPLLTEPVGITTPYLGDQKSMSLRAPDGAVVELVETAAQ